MTGGVFQGSGQVPRGLTWCEGSSGSCYGTKGITEVKRHWPTCPAGQIHPPTRATSKAQSTRGHGHQQQKAVALGDRWQTGCTLRSTRLSPELRVEEAELGFCRSPGS